jgi:hypothetical protein
LVRPGPVSGQIEIKTSQVDSAKSRSQVFVSCGNDKGAFEEAGKISSKKEAKLVLLRKGVSEEEKRIKVPCCLFNSCFFVDCLDGVVARLTEWLCGLVFSACGGRDEGLE